MSVHKYIYIYIYVLSYSFYINTLLGNISKLYKTHGTNTIKANTKGNRTVQQNDINWSKRILGKLALTQIKTNIITDDFIPNTIPQIIPSTRGLFIILL
jgi:hypothetical protein